MRRKKIKQSSCDGSERFDERCFDVISGCRRRRGKFKRFRRPFIVVATGEEKRVPVGGVGALNSTPHCMTTSVVGRPTDFN